MDSLIYYTNQYNEVEFIVSLDYNLDEFAAFECIEWGDLYEELGTYGHDPLIVNDDVDFDSDGTYDHYIWNMLAGNTYSSYAMIDHNMVVRYLFDEPDLNNFQSLYIPELIDAMYGCTDSNALNYNSSAVYEDDSCVYDDDDDINIYTFPDNIRITESSDNQKFPEISIDDDYIHLAWVAVSGNNKNIMYSRSDDFGESFSSPLQLNFISDNIVAYSQSGPKVSIYENKVYISYADDRSGYTSVYLNISENYGDTWQEEILVSDTPYLNMYQDFEVDTDGNLHLIYYNYASNHALDDVRYRFSPNENIDFTTSSQIGVVTEEMEPCDCCQPDLEIDQNGNVYVAYRNNIQNNRDTFLAVKRYNQDAFYEYYQVSDFNDYLTFCPSSGPTIDINNNQIAVAYTVYYTESGYASVSNLDSMDFTNYTNLNEESNGFPNYPYILIDNNIHVVWADQSSGNWDVYYGMRDIETGVMQNIQKINDDQSNHIQKDPIIYKHNDELYLFWSDQRNGNYEIYFSRGENLVINSGDANQDSFVDVLDIVLIVNFILGVEEPDNLEYIAADINGDNIINIQDIILLVNMILN